MPFKMRHDRTADRNQPEDKITAQWGGSRTSPARYNRTLQSLTCITFQLDLRLLQNLRGSPTVFGSYPVAALVGVRMSLEIATSRRGEILDVILEPHIGGKGNPKLIQAETRK